MTDREAPNGSYSGISPELSERLRQCLTDWSRQELAASESRLSNLTTIGIPDETIAEMRDGAAMLRARLEAIAAGALMEIFQDHESSTPDYLAQIAQSLSPGGAHNGADLLLRILFDPYLAMTASPRLLAAAIYANWHGGKAGFQFLPDPSTAEKEAYQDQADMIANILRDGGPPEAFLVDEDRAFFDALPDRFTIYRGVAGVSAELASAGLCWTIDRKVADWFANRSARIGDGAPVTLTARIHKDEVLLVNVAEREVACQPSRARQIKTLQQFDRPV